MLTEEEKVYLEWVRRCLYEGDGFWEAVGRDIAQFLVAAIDKIERDAMNAAYLEGQRSHDPEGQRSYGKEDGLPSGQDV